MTNDTYANCQLYSAHTARSQAWLPGGNKNTPPKSRKPPWFQVFLNETRWERLRHWQPQSSGKKAHTAKNPQWGATRYSQTEKEARIRSTKRYSWFSAMKKPYYNQRLMKIKDGKNDETKLTKSIELKRTTSAAGMKKKNVSKWKGRDKRAKFKRWWSKCTEGSHTMALF